MDKYSVSAEYLSFNGIGIVIRSKKVRSVPSYVPATSVCMQEVKDGS